MTIEASETEQFASFATSSSVTRLLRPRAMALPHVYGGRLTTDCNT